jgi:spore coat polysaccharide biosynthesis protein SpsF
MRAAEVRAFVQARMSSTRFPGKVLAPFRGEPIVTHVLRVVGSVLPVDDIVLLTSTEASDDPLAWYVERLGYPVWRGPRDDVFERFLGCARAFPCEWILRVSADSPLLDPAVLDAVIRAEPRGEIVTTIHPRSFPRGQNAELIKVSLLLSIDERLLTRDDREHVTAFYYRHPERFAILNVDSGDRALADRSVAVDTLEDLRRLEAL